MESIPLPPLSLEPLAENALTHGLERKRGHGTLTIQGRIEGKDAVVTFEDDGPGMEGEDLEKLIRALESCETPTGGHGMGLLGTNRRLALEYGRGYGLSVHQEACWLSLGFCAFTI
jgi:two-component system sensor histidine kinase YesM